MRLREYLRMICPCCQTENREGAKFCDECGERLIAVVSELPEVVEEPSAEEEQVDLVDTEVEQADVDEPIADVEAEPEDAVEEEPEPVAPAEEESPLAGLDVSVPIIFDPVPLKDAAPVDSAALTREIPLVVGQEYTKPENAWKTGGTLEMPRIDAPEAPSSTDFRAPDPNDKKNRKRQAKELRKQQKAAERAAKAEGGAGRKPSGAVIAIVCLIVVAAIAVGTYMLELWGGHTVPDTTGKTEADAAYILENAGFAVRVDTVPSDDTEGLVLMSDPAAGSRVQPGSEVIVHVATARTVPNVVGSSEADAVKALAKMGYTNLADIVYEKSDDSDGEVLEIEPAAGTKAKSGTKIKLKVSQAYTVPEVDALSESAAIEAIVDAGFVPIVNYVQNSEVSEGFVFGVDPAPKTKLHSGSQVTISVATSRATELVRKTTVYLEGGSGLTYEGFPFDVTSVDGASYEGGGVVSFSVTGQPIVTVLGESFRMPARQISGTAKFDDNDQLLSVSAN